MGNEKFIRCCLCDVVHHVSPFDKASTYFFVGNELEERHTDDWRLFMEQHAGHRLEALRATGEKFFPRGAPLDPMNVGYIEVTNGQDRHLVRRGRKSVQEPMSYELIRGRLADTGLVVEVQESEIKKEMKIHFSWAPASCPDDDKIDIFVGLLKEVVKSLDPRRIRVCGYSYTDDAVSYGALDGAALQLLTERCSRCFSPVELTSIRRFVEAHGNGCDVMTVLLRRRLIIEQAAC
jgi:hypothetical protein